MQRDGRTVETTITPADEVETRELDIGNLAEKFGAASHGRRFELHRGRSPSDDQ